MINKFKCVLCGKNEKGYGHSSEPLSNGVCCNDCNKTKVIPERIKIAQDWSD